MRLALLLVLTLCVAPAAQATPPTLPVLHDGAAPQVGHERVYGQDAIPVYRYEILQRYQHDVEDYTEGLFLHEGLIYEVTGQYGESRIKRWDLDSGAPDLEVRLDDRYFGEGAVVLGDRLYHLTYISNRGFIYDVKDLTLLASFDYPRQGWGLTTDGRHLIASDGSSAVVFMDPETFDVERSIRVHDAYSAVGFLNELEYVEGEIYANVWQTDYIVRFSAETGAVTGWVDLTGLNPDPETLVYPHVLNGIAYNGQPGTLLVTGKNWPLLWQIRLVPAEGRNEREAQ
ncbi:MAG: glutaminyl-peptide cyclotransferase [Pseudomonadota bacterium]